MNGIIDLSDVMFGSQLHNLPKVVRDKTIEKLTEKAYIIKNTMENKDFISIIEKVEYFH
jgi:type IV secretory pathway VirB4 component